MEKQDGAGGGGCSEDRRVGRLLAGNFVSGWASPGSPHEGVEDVSSQSACPQRPGPATSRGAVCSASRMPWSGCVRRSRRAVSAGGRALWCRLNGDSWLFAVARGAVPWRFSRTPARKQIVLAVAPGQITSLEPSINQTLAQLQALYPIPTELRNYSGLFPAQMPEGAGAGGGGLRVLGVN